MVGNRVQIDGHADVFVVVRVDQQRAVADLLQMTGVRKIVNDIPLSSIRILRHQGELSTLKQA